MHFNIYFKSQWCSEHQKVSMAIYEIVTNSDIITSIIMQLCRDGLTWTDCNWIQNSNQFYLSHTQPCIDIFVLSFSAAENGIFGFLVKREKRLKIWAENICHHTTQCSVFIFHSQSSRQFSLHCNITRSTNLRSQAKKLCGEFPANFFVWLLRFTLQLIARTTLVPWRNNNAECFG